MYLYLFIFTFRAHPTGWPCLPTNPSSSGQAAAMAQMRRTPAGWNNPKPSRLENFIRPRVVATWFPLTLIVVKFESLYLRLSCKLLGTIQDQQQVFLGWAGYLDLCWMPSSEASIESHAARDKVESLDHPPCWGQNSFPPRWGAQDSAVFVFWYSYPWENSHGWLEYPNIHSVDMYFLMQM